MASLTGTKIKDTYDSILKVSDNGALDGTLQNIADGVGNNSALSLSTAGASVGGTLSVSGNAAFDTDTLFVDAANNRVSIGTTTTFSDAKLQVEVDSNSSVYNYFRNTSTGNAAVSFIDVLSSGADLRIGAYGSGHSTLANEASIINHRLTGSLLLGTEGTERMRITSEGDVLIQTNTVGGAGGLTIRAGLNTTDYKIQLNGSGVSQAKVMELGTGQLASGYGALRMATANPGNGKYITFNAPDGSYNYADRGYIELSGTSILYTSVSDYRLKENVVSLTGALDRVDALKPCRFNFINDEDIIDGFLAHEVKEVVPHAVSGEKDAFTLQNVEVSPAVYEDVIHPAQEAILDEEGNVIEEAKEEWVEKVLVSEAVLEDQEFPVYQGIDQSKIVPLLVAAIQELRAELNALKQA